MIYFSSDFHFGHANIIFHCNRPFSNVFEMNERIVNRFNSRVSSQDITYHLGDFSMKEAVVPLFLPRLNGTHHLVSGNHDATHGRHKGSVAAKQRYLSYGFASVQDEINNFQDMFMLNHMPYTGDHTSNDRYTSFRPKDQGRWLLCGHVHQHWKVSGKMINVGVDVWDFYPVSIDEILEVVKN